ncbi:MAG: diacylglycerol kinase [Gemmatimonadota bacterium]|nr:diacylglycerol kinase [Gemmatimonadota bacterium]
MPSDTRIPTFVNPRAGSASGIVDALATRGGFDVRETPPERLPEAVRQALDEGASRVAVAGGDGTIGSAAAVLAGSDVELAVIPAGTLNHFAKFLRISSDATEASETAATGQLRRVDVAYVNDRLILNTSSVGGYVVFVRARERLESRLGYVLASAVAFVRIMARLRSFTVVVELDGLRRVFQTPLVFIAVGERELKLPSLGNRVEGGKRGLHVVVVRGKRRTRLLLLGIAVAARGLEALRHTSEAGIDSFVVDRCRIELRRPRGVVGVDGELVPMIAPLEYRIARDELCVVVPADIAEHGA